MKFQAIRKQENWITGIGPKMACRMIIKEKNYRRPISNLVASGLTCTANVNY